MGYTAWLFLKGKKNAYEVDSCGIYRRANHEKKNAYEVRLPREYYVFRVCLNLLFFLEPH